MEELKVERLSFYSKKMSCVLEECINSVDVDVSQASTRRMSHPAACFLISRGEINLLPGGCWLRSECVHCSTHTDFFYLVFRLLPSWERVCASETCTGNGRRQLKQECCLIWDERSATKFALWNLIIGPSLLWAVINECWSSTVAF